MRKLFIIFILFAFEGNAQNWDVFNKDYRYNYKYDNSPVISNVLFAETVAGNVYITNKIGVVTGTTLAIDQAQFLMKTIVKQANGNVILQDPSSITIIPTCSVSQTWTFDPSNNFTATCVSISTLTIFNVVDSVRIIIVNNVDSVVLSKQFGIIQFPKLYAQNKYYRLVGIENKATYDLNALYGEKVPNAWDFYNYEVGYTWCYLSTWTNDSPMNEQCIKGILTVKGKTITSNSYVYNVDQIGNLTPITCPSMVPPNTFTNTNLSYNGSPLATGSLGLSSSSLPENNYYPGLVIPQGYPSMLHYGIVRFGNDNIGRFYKYIGSACPSSNLGFAMPNQNEPDGYGPSGPVLPPICGTVHTWGVGLGKVTERSGYCLSGYQNYCTTCFSLNGIEELIESERSKLLYPNPANIKLNIDIELGIVRLYDPLGKIIQERNLAEEKSLDVSNLPNGLYFIEIQTDTFKSSQKLIIQH